MVVLLLPPVLMRLLLLLLLSRLLPLHLPLLLLLLALARLFPLPLLVRLLPRRVLPRLLLRASLPRIRLRSCSVLKTLLRARRYVHGKCWITLRATRPHVHLRSSCAQSRLMSCWTRLWLTMASPMSALLSSPTSGSVVEMVTSTYLDLHASLTFISYVYPLGHPYAVAAHGMYKAREPYIWAAYIWAVYVHTGASPASPMTREPVGQNPVPNRGLRECIRRWMNTEATKLSLAASSSSVSHTGPPAAPVRPAAAAATALALSPTAAKSPSAVPQKAPSPAAVTAGMATPSPAAAESLPAVPQQASPAAATAPAASAVVSAVPAAALSSAASSLSPEVLVNSGGSPLDLQLGLSEVGAEVEAARRFVLDDDDSGGDALGAVLANESSPSSATESRRIGQRARTGAARRLSSDAMHGPGTGLAVRALSKP